MKSKELAGDRNLTNSETHYPGDEPRGGTNPNNKLYEHEKPESFLTRTLA